MRVITENELRIKKSKDKNRKVYLRKNDFLTQPAKDYIKEKNLIVIYDEIKEYELMSKETTEGDTKDKYFDVHGNSYENKPEHMTHLHGNILVLKNHPRIIFRGKLDSLQAIILEAQVLTSKKEESEIVNDLNDVLNLVRNILACEVKEQPLQGKLIMGLDEEALREVSHNPNKYYGIEHFVPNYKMGEVVVAINLVRTSVREAELSAIDAFIDADGKVERPDIVKMLNRISSAVYIIFCKALSKG